MQTKDETTKIRNPNKKVLFSMGWSNISKTVVILICFTLIVILWQVSDLSLDHFSFIIGSGESDQVKRKASHLNGYNSLNKERELRSKNASSDTSMTNWTKEEIKPGSRAYYALDSVQKKLIAEVQSAAREILKVRDQLSDQVYWEKKYTTRAVLAYLPPNSTDYAAEAKALYLSIGIMRLSQPLNIKTDFIIFSPKEGFAFPQSLGCESEVRKSFKDDERCIVLQHLPTKERPPLANGEQEPLTSYSNYLDSMLILSEFQYPNLYDYVIRVDLDTFLTPGFGNWLPPKPSTLVVGQGGYGSENANNHLKWVTSKKLNLAYHDILSIGSTWYGATDLMVAVAQTTISVMRWLHTQEFSEYEQCCSGVDGWPNCQWPVKLLYGGHIAVNQLGPLNVLQSKEDGKIQMDYSSSSDEYLTSSVKHIHCWQSEDRFSKLLFHSGHYENETLYKYLDMKTARDYSSVIAISSDRLNPEELKMYIADKDLLMGKTWVRPVPVEREQLKDILVENDSSDY